MNQLARELLRVWQDAKLAVAEENDPDDQLLVDEAIDNDWYAVALKFHNLCLVDVTILALESDEPERTYPLT